MMINLEIPTIKMVPRKSKRLANDRFAVTYEYAWSATINSPAPQKISVNSTFSFS